MSHSKRNERPHLSGHTPVSRWLPETKLSAKSQSCGTTVDVCVDVKSRIKLSMLLFYLRFFYRYLSEIVWISLALIFERVYLHQHGLLDTAIRG